MSEGIVTRIGKWIDSKWEEKIGRAEFEALKANPWIGPKEFDDKIADLKTRLERLEIHTGMMRKVDPTKPAILKSAFEM